MIKSLVSMVVFQALLLFALTIQANNGIVIFNDPVRFSQCSLKTGQPVYSYYDHDPLQQASDYAGAGREKQPNTKYYIRIHYDTFHDAPAIVREWVWYHECGHHRLGHTLDITRYAESTHSIQMFERDADCFAAQEFRKHHQESELHLALKWIQKTMGTSDIRIKRIKACK